MKILYLLFPLLLLLVQGAAAWDNTLKCKSTGGFCAFVKCPSGTRAAGKCTSTYCCKST
ncbi:gallinacin-1-like [Pseudopipra pipra]|uniref:gallinacin-1-like n=1 Tax=Pseudopipra pipra TaxID=415032 RepID=UPI0031388A2C